VWAPRQARTKSNACWTYGFREATFTSIGGLVYDRLRRVLRPGDTIELPGTGVEVLSVDGVRLRDLRVQNTALSSEGPRVELRLGWEVMCALALVGRLEHVALDSMTGKVSHIVVRHNNRPVLLPAHHVEREDDGVIYLHATACDSEFERTHEFSVTCWRS
jgi:hypothetical protein